MVPVLATLGALLSVAYSFRFVDGRVLGPRRDDYPRHPHDPPVGLWLPVAVLVVPVVLIGVAPPLVEPVVDLRRPGGLGRQRCPTTNWPSGTA